MVPNPRKPKTHITHSIYDPQNTECTATWWRAAFHCGIWLKMPADLCPWSCSKSGHFLTTRPYPCAVLCCAVLCCAKSFQSCLTLCDPMDSSPPGSSVCEILQVRILEWVAMPSSRRSSQPRDQTRLFHLLPWQAGSLPLTSSGKLPPYLGPMASSRASPMAHGNWRWKWFSTNLCKWFSLTLSHSDCLRIFQRLILRKCSVGEVVTA